MKQKFVYMYETFVEFTKEAWRKCSIKTLIYHNNKKKINELWKKMRDI